MLTIMLIVDIAKKNWIEKSNNHLPCLESDVIGKKVSIEKKRKYYIRHTYFKFSYYKQRSK